MPLKRTPPSSPAVTVGSPVPIPSRTTSTFAMPTNELTSSVHHQQHSSLSDPNLNVTHRRKKRSQCDDDGDKLNNFMNEMRALFTQFKEDQEVRADKLYSVVENIRESLDFLGKKFELLQTRLEKLENLRDTDVQNLRFLEERLESAERISRSSCLEIRNIPVTPSETKSSLLDTFIKIGEVLNVPIQKTEVKDIFRIKTKDPASRTVIVDLCSTLQKEKIIHMYRKFNRGTSRLSTEHLHIGGQTNPVFISENLTTRMKRLFFLARDHAKVNNIRFCWVSQGKIFMRKRENGPLVRVTKESDLDRLQSQG